MTWLQAPEAFVVSLQSGRGVSALMGRMIARLARRRDGNVLPLFALALIPTVGMVGAAVDYSRANDIRAGLQAAIDAAVLAGARDGTANWANVALDTFNANFKPKGATVLPPTFSATPGGIYAASVTGSVPAEFLGVVGVSTIPIAAQARAALRGASAGQFCVLVLNKTAQSAFQLNGNATIEIKAPQCILQVNSNANGAVSLNGNTAITTFHNCFVGSVVKVGNASVSPPPAPLCKPVPDPFANHPKPTAGACSHTNFSASGNQALTLQPGVYCGGMKFTGQVAVTFAPGLYIIKDGVLEASGGTSFTGEGVTFFLTGQGAGVDITGQADWRLVAPTSGLLRGFVFFLELNGPSGIAATWSKLAGTAEMYFEGLIYLPHHVTLTGGSETATPSPYTAYIADTLDINGNGTLVIHNDPTKTAVPIPSGIQFLAGGQPSLIE